METIVVNSGKVLVQAGSPKTNKITQWVAYNKLRLH